MKRRNLLRFISVFVLTFVLACSGIISPDTAFMSVRTVKVSAAKAKISPKKKTVTVGTTFKIKIKNAKKKYTWTSSDPSVAKVKTKKGKSTKIAAVSAGKATITATLNGKTYKCTVTVKAADAKPTAVPTPTPIPSLQNCNVTTDNKSSFTVAVGGKLQLNLVGKDATRYSVSDTSCAEITSSGLLTAKKASSDPIKVTIIDKFDNRYYCTVKIISGSGTPTPTPTAKPTAAPTPTAKPTATPKPTAAPTPVPGKAYLDPASVELTPGETFQIKLVGTEIMHCMQSGWDDDYADVTTSGKITAKKAGVNLIINVYGTDMNMYEFRLTIGSADVKELSDSEIDKLLAKDTYGILISHNKINEPYEDTLRYTFTDNKSMILACHDGLEKGATTIVLKYSDNNTQYWMNQMYQELKTRSELDGYFSYASIDPYGSGGNIAVAEIIYKVGWKAVLALTNKGYTPDEETTKLLREAYRIADKAAKLYPGDTRKTLLYINNLLCDKITYSDPFPPEGDVPQRDATGALYLGDAVCEGYTSALRLILNILGLENQAICNKRGSHVWNYVKVDGTWYHIDVTWNDVKDGSGSYTNYYFMLTDSQMQKKNASSSDTGLHDWYPIYTD